MDRPGEPTIRECVPTAGPVGSKVTIHGVNFGKAASERVVSFNSVRAEEIDPEEGGLNRPNQDLPARGRPGKPNQDLPDEGVIAGPKTRDRGAEDQKNLQSGQAPVGAVEQTEKNKAANDAKNAEPGKREKDQEAAQQSAAATGGKTGAAKQPGDVAAQTQGSSATIADANLPPVERGELGPEGHGVAGAVSTATVTHRQADPSSEEVIHVTVPEGATPGDIVVTVNGIASNGSRFTVTAV